MLAERLTSQALAGIPLKSPEAVAERILAIQAQDPSGARLAVRARSRGLTAGDVDEALNDRTLVISWLNRGTLHLVRSEDFAWLHALTVPRLATANRTRLKQEGVTPAQAEKGSKVVVKALAGGPKSRSEIRDRLDSAGVPTAGQALVHILLYTTIKGSILRGPVSGGEQRFVLVEDWLGKQEKVDPETSLAELARRYLSGHAAATYRDLANWAGITLGDARRGLGSIAGEIDEMEGSLLALKSRPRATRKLPKPKLLGAFDPVLHGWATREFLIPSEQQRAVVTTNGIFRPTILVKGQVDGIWRRPGGKVEMEPFVKPPAPVRKELEADAVRVSRFFGSP